MHKNPTICIMCNKAVISIARMKRKCWEPEPHNEEKKTSRQVIIFSDNSSVNILEAGHQSVSLCTSAPRCGHLCNTQWLFRRTERYKQGLCFCLPPCLALPLLFCDVFWPDSKAPGRQWHDHRNRGQKGHSSLLVDLEMSLAILAFSNWDSFVKHLMFPFWEKYGVACGRPLWYRHALCSPADWASLLWKSTYNARTDCFNLSHTTEVKGKWFVINFSLFK